MGEPQKLDGKHRLQHVTIGAPVEIYSHKAWDRLPKGVSVDDLWSLCGPQVEKHMRTLPLWKVFAVVYFEGLAHGAAAERERIKKETP